MVIVPLVHQLSLSSLFPIRSQTYVARKHCKYYTCNYEFHSTSKHHEIKKSLRDMILQQIMRSVQFSKKCAWQNMLLEQWAHKLTSPSLFLRTATYSPLKHPGCSSQRFPKGWPSQRWSITSREQITHADLRNEKWVFSSSWIVLSRRKSQTGSVLGVPYNSASSTESQKKMGRTGTQEN